jgi:hypothetical protein
MNVHLFTPTNGSFLLSWEHWNVVRSFVRSLLEAIHPAEKDYLPLFDFLLEPA